MKRLHPKVSIERGYDQIKELEEDFRNWKNLILRAIFLWVSLLSLIPHSNFSQQLATMSNQNISFTITLPSTQPIVNSEAARPFEFSSLPPPHTQQALKLSRQIGVSIEAPSQFIVSISSPPLPSTHPAPIQQPHSPPVLNIPTSLPHRIHKDPPENEKEFLREHLHQFINHCHHELDILEGRRALTKLYKDSVAYDVMSQKYDKLWTIWEESRKLFQLLSE